MTAQQRAGTPWPRFYGYDQVTGGKLDGLPCRAVQQLDALPPGPVTVQFASEPDTDHEFGITLNGHAHTWAQADALAIPAYTYLIDYFQVFNRTYAWLPELPAAAQGKDVVVAEWGTRYSLNDQAAWIAQVPAAITRLNRIRMTNYFDSDGDWGTLNPRQAGLDALKAAYATAPYATPQARP